MLAAVPVAEATREPPSPIGATIRPGYRGLIAFCESIGEPLEPYQRRIARAHFGPEREMVAVLPRGNAKTTTAALIGLHHLLTVPGAAVTIGAASRDQARIAYERMRGFALHPTLEDNLLVRHLELRHEGAEGLRLLRVIAADGPRAHGLSSTLYLGDEVWAWRDEQLLEAMLTGLVKRPDSKLLLISTAAALLDSPLGRLRARAMAQPSAKRTGPVVTAGGELAWIEWSIPDETSLDDMAAVKRANPAPWIGRSDLQRQRAAVAELPFAQLHAGRWGAREGTWLPAGAWQACASDTAGIEEGEQVWVGVDVGGSRAASAVVLVTEDLRVLARTWQGDDAVLKVADHCRDLADRYTIRELIYDPWRFRSEALRLEEAGLPVVEFAQSNVRMVPASEQLYSAIIEQRLKHQNDPALNGHVASAIAKQTPRGWRIDKAKATDQVDAVVALAMAVDRASTPVAPARLLGWL